MANYAKLGFFHKINLENLCHFREIFPAKKNIENFNFIEHLIPNLMETEVVLIFGNDNQI